MFCKARFAGGLLLLGIVAAVAGAIMRVALDVPQAFGPSDVPLAAAVLLVLGAAVTLRRREWHAREAESSCRRLLDAACDAVIVVGPDRRIVHISPRGAELFGYGPNETLVGRPCRELLPDWSPSPEDWPTAVQASANDENGADFTGRTQSGATLALEITARPTNGSPPGAMALLVRDVTRARRACEELRAKEAHLRLIVEQMPAILWTTNAQLQITSTVGAGLAALNLQPTELIGMSMQETLNHNDPASTPVSAHLQALNGESLTHEMEWKGRNFQVRVDPLRNPERRITGTIGIVLDVTDQKQTMNELKARVRQQAAIAGLGQRALTGGDIDELLQEAAQVVCDTLDVELCEMLELTTAGDLLRPRVASGWWARGRETVEAAGDSPAGRAVRTLSSISSADLRLEPSFAADPLAKRHGVVSTLNVLVQGRDRPLGVLSAHATRHRPFSDNDRNILQAAANVLAAAIDRKHAEATNNRLVALLEATTDAVAIAGAADHRLLYVNRAGRSMFGLSEQDDVGGFTLADFYAGDQRGRFDNELLPTALKQGTWSGEITLQGRNGQQYTVSQLALVHRALDGDVQFLSTVSRDHGEKHRLEEQLRQAQKMEAVGRLAGGIAHDFNNLLCIITGYTEMALMQVGADSPLHGPLTEVQKAGNRAAILTGQLLAFSRKTLLAPKLLDLNALVRDAGGMLRRLIGEDIELVTSFGPQLPAVKADPNQLEQILMNLAVNARDAMPQGGRLEVRTSRVTLTDDDVRDQPEVKPGSYVQLAVADTGCGMDEATRARIFEPFFTTKGVGKGTGLGLAMVYGILKQSGGHIDLDTAPGKGTTFRAYLPCDIVARAEVSAPANPAAVFPGTETVLLAEDEEGVRALVLQVLRHSGYTVLEARNGEEALALSEQHPGPIHLLLTDVVMPRLGGSRLAKRLHRQRPDTRVLFMSGFADSTLVRHEVISGDIDCLLKPFSPEALARKVRETLDSADTALAS